MDLILLFPGQGSQKPGMGKDLAAAFDSAREVFEEIDAALGEPLSKLCFDGPADALTLTQNAQPALFAHGAAVWAVVRDHVAPFVRAAAGHSLGEFTAYYVARTFTLRDAARLVRQRGQFMFDAAVARPGTMAAILGATSRSIDDICAEASENPEGGIVVPANYNSPGQVVISGELAGVEKAMELATASGAKRSIRLDVSGAFHSPLMAPARAGLSEALRKVHLASPSVPVYANANAEPVTDAVTARTLLIEQLTAPVRWTQTIERLAQRFPNSLFVEMGPGSVLTGLVKKIVPGAQVLTCGGESDLNALLANVTP